MLQSFAHWLNCLVYIEVWPSVLIWLLHHVTSRRSVFRNLKSIISSSLTVKIQLLCTFLQQFPSVLFLSGCRFQWHCMDIKSYGTYLLLLWIPLRIASRYSTACSLHSRISFPIFCATWHSSQFNLLGEFPLLTWRLRNIDTGDFPNMRSSVPGRTN